MQHVISNQPLSIDQLSVDDQQRVAEIVEGCMLALEQGQEFSIEDLIQSHPDLSEPLRHCLASLQTLHGAVHGSRGTLPNHPALPVDGRIGDFELGQVLGRGGMGIVYNARQISLDRTVALKILPTNSFSHPKQIQRFLLEAKSAANLHHPNVVPVYAVGEEAGIYFYAMQLIDGQTLAERPAESWKPHRWRSLLDATITIAQTLQHAHDCGIIHRDIKPANLLMDQTGHVWITDFGLARRIQDNGLTQTGELVGTASYMSPEQARGLPVDERTDVYSLGITLYELITGRPAFVNDQPRSVLARIETEEPPNPREIDAKISIDLETVILKAIAKDREDRYASAEAFAADLIAVRDGRAILGRRPSLTKRASRWIATHKAFTAVATSGVCICFIIMTIALAEIWIAKEHLSVALHQTQILEKDAQTNYWQCRNLVDQWNKQLVPALSNLSGTDTIRAQMLTDTIQFYESYLTRASQDSNLYEDIYSAKLQLASAYQHANRHDDAINLLQSILHNENDGEKAMASSPGPIRHQRIAQNDLALIFHERGDHATAAEYLVNTIDAYQAQMKQGNTPVDVITGCAAAHVNLASVYQSLEKHELKQQSLCCAERLYREAIVREPSNGHIQSELAVVRDHQALSVSEGELRDAIDAAEEAVRLHRTACMDKSNDSLLFHHQRIQRLGASLHNLAVLQSKSGDFDHAREHFGEAIQIREKQTHQDPLQPLAWNDLAISLNSLGLLECQQQQWTAAEAAFERAIKALMTLVYEIDRGSTLEYKEALKLTRENLAKASRLATDHSSVTSKEVQTVTPSQRLVASDPDERGATKQNRWPAAGMQDRDEGVEL